MRTSRQPFLIYRSTPDVTDNGQITVVSGDDNTVHYSNNNNNNNNNTFLKIKIYNKARSTNIIYYLIRYLPRYFFIIINIINTDAVAVRHRHPTVDRGAHLVDFWCGVLTNRSIPVPVDTPCPCSAYCIHNIIIIYYRYHRRFAIDAECCFSSRADQ